MSLMPKVKSKITLSSSEFDRLVQHIKNTYKSDDGYVYPVNEEHSAGFIVQSHLVTYTANSIVKAFIKGV